MWGAKTRKIWTLSFTKRPCPMVVSRVWRTFGLVVTDDTRLAVTIIIIHLYKEYYNPLHNLPGNCSHKKNTYDRTADVAVI